MQLLARVHRLGLLSPKLRDEVAEELEQAALIAFDSSFMSKDDVLALIPPSRLIRLTTRLVDLLDDEIPQRIMELAEEADPDSDLVDHFDDIRSFISRLREAFDEETVTQQKLSALDRQIEKVMEEVSKRKSDKDEEEFWPNVTPAKVTAAPREGRSVFSDVDE